MQISNKTFELPSYLDFILDMSLSEGFDLELYSTNDKMVVWGLVVWISGIPFMKGIVTYRGSLESQTTGPQTTNLSLVDVYMYLKHDITHILYTVNKFPIYTTST